MAVDASSPAWQNYQGRVLTLTLTLPSPISPLQPVSVAVDASSLAWQNYQGGVITDADNCGTTLDHAVLAVGYNNNAATPYLYLQNQWGTGRV